MRVLITGGAGFLGSHLCDALLRRGDQVIAVDNLATATADNIAHFQDELGFHFLHHDVRHPLEMEGPLDAVLHFASPASPLYFVKHAIETLETGALGAWHALDLAHKTGAVFLLASTSEIYGDPQVNPQPESYHGNVDPVALRACYDEAKRFAEALAMAFRREKGVDARILRIFNTYGPRMQMDDGRVIPTFVRQALTGQPLTVFGDGSQTRSFCYVSDLIEGVLLALKKPFEGPLNMGNPEEVSILDLARLVLKITGSRSEITFEPLPENDPRTRRPEISRAREILRWEPHVPLREGLSVTIDHMRALTVPAR